MTILDPIFNRREFDLDTSISKLMIDVLRYTDETFDSSKINHYLANQIFSATNVDQIEFISLESGNQSLVGFRLNKDNKEDETVTTSITREVEVKGVPMAEVHFNYFGDTKPQERFLEALPYLMETLGLVISRYLERLDLERNQTKTIVSALANDYGNITFIDLVNDTDRILKANNSGVLVNDDKNEVRYVERLQHYIDEFVVPEQRNEMSVALALPTVIEQVKDGKPYIVSCRICINDEIHYRSIKHVPQIEKGKLVAIVIGYQSVDAEHEHQKELEMALQKAEAGSRAKTNFLFNMSHDIRTPMNAIIGFTAMAKTHADEKDKVIDYINKISTSSNQLLTLINQVLEMSRIESGKVVIEAKTFDLIDKIEESEVIFGELCRQKSQQLIVDIKNIKHRFIESDPERISQVVNNLLGNAYKYTLEGGTITLEVSQEEIEGENKVINKILIKDNGIGMSKEYQAHIFEEFSREKSSTVSKIQGSGLGMSIVKSVCDMLGAEIKIESKQNQGTTVIITLETTYGEVDTDNLYIVDRKTDFSIKGLRILVVEDNPLNREIAQDILEEAGAIVDCAEDGDVAIDKVCNSDPGDIDVILMDVQMPRMNGYEATKVIRNMMQKKLANIPIIAMTANAFEEDKKDAIEAGMNDHIAKPIDIKKLMVTLSKYMKKPNAGE